MKVLITSDTFDPMLNGVVVSIHNLVDVLTQRGHEVRILALSETHETYIRDNVYAAPSFPLKVYPNARGAHPYDNPHQQELMNWGPDIVHSQTEFFTFTYGAKIAKKLRIPMVHTYHTLYEHYTEYIFFKAMHPQGVLSLFVRTKMRNLDAIVVPSQKALTSLNNMGVNKYMEVIPTGIDLSAFAYRLSLRERCDLLQALGIDQDALIIATVGRLAKEKNVQELLRYFPTLSRQEPRLVFLIVGDGPYRERLEATARQMGMTERVRFTGLVPPQKVYQYYQLAHLFVNASISETQGLTYVEALANGIPLLCRRDSCLEEILLDGVNGHYFETEEEFVQYALTVLHDDDMRTRMQDNAWVTARRFSKEAFGESIERLYNEMITSSSQGHTDNDS